VTVAGVQLAVFCQSSRTNPSTDARRKPAGRSHVNHSFKTDLAMTWHPSWWNVASANCRRDNAVAPLQATSWQTTSSAASTLSES